MNKSITQDTQNDNQISKTIRRFLMVFMFLQYSKQQIHCVLHLLSLYFRYIFFFVCYSKMFCPKILHNLL